MNTRTTVFARSKELEVLVTDCLSVEELVDDLRALVVSVESYCLSPVEHALCRKRYENAFKRARLDTSLFEYSVEGFKDSGDKILKGLYELIARLLAELGTFWTESFGHAKRLRHRIDALRATVVALPAPRPKRLIVDGEYGITRVLAPATGVLAPPVALASELLLSNVSVLDRYSSTLGRWLERAYYDDSPAPIPKLPSQGNLPGDPSLYSRDENNVVWGLRFNSPKIALDAAKSQLTVGSRADLEKICDSVYEALDTMVAYERNWNTTEKALKKLLREIEATGSKGYDAAKARKIAYAASALPRQWGRYGLYLSAQLVRYVSVSIAQY